MHQAGRVMCCFGRAVRTRLVFFFFPAPAVRVVMAATATHVVRPLLLVVSATTRTECTTT
jgi:hypothetical protein